MAQESMQFKAKGFVTLPILKIDDTQEKKVYVRIIGGIFTAPPLEGSRNRTSADGQEKKPPQIMKVEDLIDKDRPKQLIANAVMASELRRAYDNYGYVGRCFSIAKTGVKSNADRKYALYEIIELEDPKGVPGEKRGEQLRDAAIQYAKQHPEPVAQAASEAAPAPGKKK